MIGSTIPRRQKRSTARRVRYAVAMTVALTALVAASTQAAQRPAGGEVHPVKKVYELNEERLGDLPVGEPARRQPGDSQRAVRFVPSSTSPRIASPPSKVRFPPCGTEVIDTPVRARISTPATILA